VARVQASRGIFWQSSAPITDDRHAAVSPRPAHTLRVVADQLSPLTLAEPLLTADQVSRLLGIPRSSVYEYARRARDPLPAVRIGRHVRFHRSALERWLADLHG
jgi:excisionase family DNA binding protein